jgi:hypothetical protein
MPLALIAIAWLAIMTGINGNYADVGKQFESDVLNNGQGGGFLSFMAGLVSIAVFFRVIGLPNAGRVFLILVIVVFLLENANVLTALQSIGGSAAPSASATPPNTTGSVAPGGAGVPGATTAAPATTGATS